MADEIGHPPFFVQGTGLSDFYPLGGSSSEEIERGFTQKHADLGNLRLHRILLNKISENLRPN